MVAIRKPFEEEEEGRTARMRRAGRACPRMCFPLFGWIPGERDRGALLGLARPFGDK